MEPKPSDDRWKELADLLGLPSDQGAAPSAEPSEAKPIAAAPVEIPNHRAEPETVRYEAPADHDTYEAIEDTIEEPDENLVDDPELAQAAADEEMGADEDEDLIEGSTIQGEDAEEAQPVGGEEDKPKRGRRRRRRGRRRNGDKPEGEPGEPARPPESRDPRAGQQRPRDDRNARPAQPAASRDRDANAQERGDPRSRRGRREDPHEAHRSENQEHEEFSEELEEVDAIHTPTALARSLDDDTDFSDWNVPSWQELISSLYRPDR